MKGWSNVNLAKPAPKPIEEKVVGIDWLNEVDMIKKECRVKTEVNEVVYPPVRSIRVSNKTETVDFYKK